MSEVICSEKNPLIKRIRKLQQKKKRDASGQMIIEGSNLIREAVQKGICMDALLISDIYPSEPWMKELSKRGVRVERVDAFLFEKITDARNGVGLLAIVDRPVADESQFENCFRPGSNCVVLDRLQDPGNIGTIIRTAVAAGYDAIVTMKGTGDVYSPKVLRATAGMIFDVPIVPLSDSRELVKLAHDYGKRIAVTTPDGGIPYYDCDLRQDVFLVIGNEGNGIGDELIEASDIRVTLPMYGGIESLNAAVSAGILMYERVRSI